MKTRARAAERTGFQEGSSYSEKIDLQSDFVMVYGIDSRMPERIKSWKERGYVVHLMTGVSWGEYQDYLNGKEDGRSHWDEAQKGRNYENIIHGTSEDIPYMVPTIAYTDFLTGRIQLAVDAGVEAIHLEEPEFWVEGGYSDAFKREWELYYKEAWKAPHETEDAQYRASKLKSYLFTRCLDRLCNTLKEYAKVKYNRNLRFYVPTLLTLMNTLGDMEQNDVAWLNGNTEVGLLLADSAMFQRNGPQWSEEATAFKYDGTDVKSAEGEEFKELLDWSPFYGLALPLLKHGLPVRPVQLDNVRRFTGYLDDYRVLVLSYEYMKPEYPDLHNAIAQWVHEGGALIYVGDGNDSFHQVREWWNQGKRIYANPAEHLFESLGLAKNLQSGIHAVGKGSLTLLSFHPALAAKDKAYASRLRVAVRSAITLLKDPDLIWDPTNGFVLQRGPYTIVAVMEESVNENPIELKGTYMDLLDSELPIIVNPLVYCGGQGLFYNLSCVEPGVQLIAAASRIELIEEHANGFSFTAKGPRGIKAIACFQCKEKPNVVLALNAGQEPVDVTFEWEASASIVRLRYDNSVDGIEFKLTS